MFRGTWKRERMTTWSLLAAMVLPLLLAGCAGGGRSAAPPPVDDSAYGRGAGPNTSYGTQLGAPAERSSGMSKTVMLAGAAALYYMYKKHQSSAAQGPEGQYYLSRNGRVYYRDAEHRAHWITPPSQGLQVPAHEAQGLESFQGYENKASGRDLTNLPEGRM